MASKELLPNLPPPPQEIPPGVIPMKAEPGKGCASVSERLRPNFNQMNRHRPGVKGKKIFLLTNYFRMGDISSSLISFSNALLFFFSAFGMTGFDFRSKTDCNLSSNEDLSEGDQKRQKIISPFKTFLVRITFVSIIPFQSMLDGPHGVKSRNNEVLIALDTMLQHSNAKRDCLLLRQSYFPNKIKNLLDLTGGILGCRGFRSSFQSVQGGLFFNLDTSTTTIIQPGPLVNFLIANQNVENPFKIDWAKAKQILKNLRIKLLHTNREHKITGLSNRPCEEEKFLLRLRSSNNQNDNVQTVEVTVYEYFVRRHGIELTYSSKLPCINVGSQREPQFIPVEELKTNDYDTDPMLRACGISINKSFTEVEGRILSPPQLRVGNKEDLTPRFSRWSFNGKKFAEPKRIEFWAVMNFSTGVDIRAFCIEMAKLGAKKGMNIHPPAFVFEENAKHKKKPGPWKKRCLMNFGIRNQCIVKNRVDEAYLTSVILKVNAKLGGLNSLLSAEVSQTIPFLSKVPTMILAMGVTHAPSSRSDLPSVAAACKFLDETWSPKFTLIVAQRRHHTKLFQANSSDNIPPGTVVDTKICHPLYKNNFYMCSHAAGAGTSRPIQYFVLLDEIGFSSDNVQELVHCLCYVSQRCTSAIYEVAPIRYARLGSAQMAYEEVAIEAIKHALKALRKRHLVEEGAHAPALVALNRPLVLQGSEWKEKAENLEVELQQCYKAQARLSEQLVVEVAESRASKSLVQEKETIITDLQSELNQARDECSRLTELLEEKTKGLELLMGEHQELKAQLEATTLRANNAEAENKTLVDRWMLQKMQDAERLNEANALYEDMLDKVKASSIEKLARQQVDGVVRQSEDGAEFYVESSIPSTCKQRIPAHDGGCASILFEYNSSKLISGGQDRAIKMWDTASGSLTNSLYGCLGSVLDLSITHDNKLIIAASSSNNLYVWDANSGRIRHTLTGHIDKVCAVDVSKFSSRHVVSAAYDRTIKVWDLQKGYCTNTIIFHSNCNSLSFSMDGLTICSGHVDGNLRLWDAQTGKLLSEVAAHSQAVTSVSLSRNGNMILTSGRDNLHNLFDIRTLEICGTFRANANRVASNWSRSCISADDSYVTAGSVDGSVHIWSVSNTKMVSTLKEHTSAVLCCSWSGLGKPLATSDKSGIICIWS
ncbi:hypothetical protein HAX54_030183 [Datura stramonium]|uniref:Uncharacterized protein n=1 Tax=Datura stramonium TaxID=4076 RepID=A0ABS8V9M5_DATST|nr:hypothetical protein [Datura stramonium]